MGDLEAAIAAYEKVIAEHPDDVAIAAKAQLRIGFCDEKLKRTEEALKAYNELVSAYPDQPEAEQAWKRFEALGAEEIQLEHGLTDKDINLEKARIAQEKEVASLDIEKNLIIEKAQIEQTRQVQEADIQKNLIVETARIAQEQAVQERDIERNLIIETTQIEQTRRVQEAELQRLLSLDLADIEKSTAIEKAKIEFEVQVKQKIIEVATEHHNWFATNTKLVVFKLKHINAEEILPVVETFLSEHSIAVADGQTNTLVVRDVEACVGDAITIIEKVDVPPEGE